MTADAPVLVSTPRQGITQLTLNRPGALNAMTAELIEQLHEELDAADRDPSCRVVVITGSGRGFCAGLDLKGYGTPPAPPVRNVVADGLATQQHIAGLVPHFQRVRKPIIAAVNGPATGGGLALVLASDIRIGAQSSRYSAAFIKIAVSGCDIGTSYLLPKIVGVGRAHEMMLTGRIIDADEAYRIGLIVDLVPDAELLARAYDEAEMVMTNGPFAVWMTKETMWASLECGSLRSAIDLENRTQIMASQSGEGREAIGAFLAKRPPVWG